MLAALGLAAPTVGSAAEREEGAEASARTTITSFEEADRPSEELGRVAEWIATSRDNDSLPYIIIDKKAASLFLFDAKGESLGQAPVLIGIATGDEATPGIGGKNLAEIGPAERTTPAGRFVAKFGWAVRRQKVLWVDYGTSVALHAVVTGNKREQRLHRLLSPDVEDNRITFGCINVPTVFYNKSVQPLFEEEGGIVYILPDERPLEDVFPRLRVQPFLASGAL